MKIFLDTNVLLDYVQQRENYHHVRLIFKYALDTKEENRIYASFLSFADAAYLMRKKCSIADIKSYAITFRKYFDILPNNDENIESALKNDCPDFEDALQISCAESKDCDCIITSNLKHFSRYTNIPVVTPGTFVSLFGRKKES